MFCGTKRLKEINGKRWCARTVVQKNKVLGGEDDKVAASTRKHKGA